MWIGCFTKSRLRSNLDFENLRLVCAPRFLHTLSVKVGYNLRYVASLLHTLHMMVIIRVCIPAFMFSGIKWSSELRLLIVHPLIYGTIPFTVRLCFITPVIKITSPYQDHYLGYLCLRTWILFAYRSVSSSSTSVWLSL